MNSYLKYGMKFLFFSIYFYIFMIVESLVNERVEEVCGGGYVVPFYAGSLMCTAVGYTLYGIISRQIYSKKKSLPCIVAATCVLFICICSVSIYMINARSLLIFSSATAIIFLGFIGGYVHHMVVNPFKRMPHVGTILGGFMAGAIVVQFVTQNIIVGPYAELILLLMFEAGLFVLSLFLKIEDDKDNGNTSNSNANISKKKVILVCVLVAVMSFVLGINDEIMVSFNANNEVQLFSSVRLFYALGLLVAGVISDFMDRKLMPLATGCAMLLSIIATTFLEDVRYYNFNMSIMYFYSGFYVIFLTFSFLIIAVNARNQGMLAGMGRIVRCIATAAITLIMYLLNDNLNVIMLIIVNCIMTGVIFVILTINEMLTIKNSDKEQEYSEEYYWKLMVDKYSFTQRENDVAWRLICTSKSIQEIADELFISKRVVQRHITSIYEKTGKGNRTDLVKEYFKSKEND